MLLNLVGTELGRVINVYPTDLPDSSKSKYKKNLGIK